MLRYMPCVGLSIVLVGCPCQNAEILDDEAEEAEELSGAWDDEPEEKEIKKPKRRPHAPKPARDTKPAVDTKPSPVNTLTFSPKTDAFIEAQMKKAKFPGLAGAVVRRGKVVWAKGYGYADRNSKRLATADTPFFQASVSKTIVAVMAMHTLEAGLLELDTDINTYLPFSVRHPDYPKTFITVRMLMTHTSGIEDNWDVMGEFYVEGDSPVPLDEFLEDYLTEDGDIYAQENYGERKPGAHSSYSNIGTSLLGLIVEQVTKTPFHKYSRTVLFKPLGMSNTSWMLRDLNRKEVAVPYTWSRKGYKAHPHYGVPDYPDGQLRSSARDMGRFLAVVDNKGQSPSGRILKRSTVKTMLTSQGFGAQALIWGRETDDDGVVYIEHEGAEKGATTLVALRLNERLGCALMANGSQEDGEEDVLLADICTHLLDNVEER